MAKETEVTRRIQMELIFQSPLKRYGNLLKKELELFVCLLLIDVYENNISYFLARTIQRKKMNVWFVFSYDREFISAIKWAHILG